MRKKSINIIGIFVLVATLFLTVGYSAFNDSLTISQVVAKVRAQADIRVTGVTTTSSGATVTNTDYTINTISSNATLSQNGTITYTITVKNMGNVPMTIYSIDESGLPSDLKITNISGYNIKEKICDDSNNSLCTLNATKTFTITIGYDNYVSDSTVYNITLGFEFVPIYDVTYNNINVESTYLTHAYGGKTFEVEFVNDIPYDVNLNQNFPHTYTNNTLTVNNINADFTINRYYSITYNLDGGVQAANQPIKYLAGSNVTILDPTKTDYTFNGWYDNSSFTGNAITDTNGLSGDLTLYAKWNSTQHIVIPITSLVEGDHIIYVDANGVDRECVILYDATSSYGIQAITTTTVEDFEIGNGTGSTTAVYNSGTSGKAKFNKAIDSYNNARQNLNNKAREYINTDLSPASGARVVGSPPNNPDVENAQLTSSNYTYINSYNVQKEDNYYTIDINKMTSLNLVNISDSYWLGSLENGTVGNRSTLIGNYYVNKNSNTVSYIRHLSLNSSTNNSTSKSYTHGLRPVFTLKNSLNVEEENNGIYSLIVPQ